MASVSLWSAVPHYVSLAPSPRAARALCERLGDLIGTPIDVTELAEAESAYADQVSRGGRHGRRDRRLRRGAGAPRRLDRRVDRGGRAADRRVPCSRATRDSCASAKAARDRLRPARTADAASSGRTSLLGRGLGLSGLLVGGRRRDVDHGRALRNGSIPADWQGPRPASQRLVPGHSAAGLGAVLRAALGAGRALLLPPAPRLAGGRLRRGQVVGKRARDRVDRPELLARAVEQAVGARRVALRTREQRRSDRRAASPLQRARASPRSPRDDGRESWRPRRAAAWPPGTPGWHGGPGSCVSRARASTSSVRESAPARSPCPRRRRGAGSGPLQRGPSPRAAPASRA